MGIGANLRLNAPVRSSGKLNVVIWLVGFLRRDPISRSPTIILHPHLVAKFLQPFQNGIARPFGILLRCHLLSVLLRVRNGRADSVGIEGPAAQSQGA
jgi:hypothetical protein